MNIAQICKNYFKNYEGFTLVELLVTVILVAVLASYSVYYYNNSIDEGKVNAAKGKLAALGGATARYFIEEGELDCPVSGIPATNAYVDTCGLHSNDILNVFACGKAEPSLAYESNFDFFFGCPRKVSGCGSDYTTDLFNGYTVFMKPKAGHESSVFPDCAYFDMNEDKVIEVHNND